MSKYETGEREPDYETLKHLADYFNVSLDYLLGRSDIRNTVKPEDPLADLPKDAKKEIESFIEFVRQKYKNKK